MTTDLIHEAEAWPEVRSASAAAPVSTKLRVPSTPANFVSRQRLVDRLTKGLARGVVLVAAPAGSGKTAMVADWVQHLDQSVAWLSVDDADNEAARFWTHLIAALSGPLRGIERAIGWTVDAGAATGAAALVEGLINVVHAAGEDVVLVIDGYDRIRDASIHEGMAVLLERRPDCLKLVLACRGEPGLPMARLRATGHLFELGATDLRMRDDEVAAAVRNAGLDLPNDSVRSLATRTEGWAAGVELACVSLQGQERQSERAAAFSGRNRYVLDYLVEDVLLRQPMEIRKFLRETSILDRISADLAASVTGRDDSQALLERIERADLFLIPLDDRRKYWRYHGLFAESLRARLLELQPQDVPRLHRAASAWHAEQGQIEDAVRHAVEAGDAGTAATWIGETSKHSRQVPIPATAECLSAREFEVLTLVAAGRTNREIAEVLFITVDTVKRHVTHILGKLGTRNRTEAVAHSRRLGLLD